MSLPVTPAPLANALSDSLSSLQHRFAQRIVTVGDSEVSYRSCGRGTPVVLLHGIGSGGASWLHCALALEDAAQVIAWDAPGYGKSTRLEQAAPSAADYAARLEGFLQALDIQRCVLVGHSLVAMMAAAHAAGSGADRLAKLLLVSPAQGYGTAERRERGLQIQEQRLANLAALGVSGMADNAPRRRYLPLPACRHVFGCTGT